ncbi:MAG: hypothetical protein IJ612_01265 [Prevotella sp.]|nr:hypothetical protein [Prevotella sp.]
MRKRTLALLAVLTVFARLLPLWAEDYTKYLFVYFPSNDNENIYYALSDKESPFDFVPMNNGQMIISADTIALKRGVRDPHLLRGDDGWFYMVNTDMRCAEGWSSNRGIVLMRSRDLVNWQHSTVHFPDKYAGTSFAHVTRVWAPETIWDPEAGKYMVYFSLLTDDGSIPYDKVFYCYANDDFTDLVGEPVYLFDRGSATIDMDIVYNEKDHLYHAFYKNEGQGGICKVTASRLTAAPGQEPGSQWGTPSGTLQQTRVAVEGAGVWRLIDSDTWILMYDCYGSGYYQFCESTDLTNFTLRAQTNTSGMFTPRHGTVLPVTDAEVAAIEKSFGNDLETRTKLVEGASTSNPIVTPFVVNGQMDLGSTGWSSTTGARNQGTATNQHGDFQVPFWENWNPKQFAGKMYQTVTYIPNGTYELRIAAFVDQLGAEGTQYVYAGNDRQNLITGEPTAYSVVTYVSDNTLEIGLCQQEAVGQWMGIDCVSLTYYGPENAVDEVRTLVNNRLRAELLQPLTEEIGVAEMIGSIDVGPARQLLSEPTLTKAQVNAEVERLKVAEWEVVSSDYTTDRTQLLGGWTTDNVSSTMHGQHWDGTSGSTYYEQRDGWAGYDWQMSMSQQLTLPAGNYILKVACRSASSNVDAQVRVNHTSMHFPTKGDAGRGIDTEGRANFDATAQYANNGGRGWEWRYVPFTASDASPVEIAFTGSAQNSLNQWMSFTSIALLAPTPTGLTAPTLQQQDSTCDGGSYNLGGRLSTRHSKGIVLPRATSVKTLQR